MIFVCISDPDIDKNVKLIEKYKKVELRLDLIKPEIELTGLMLSKAHTSICTYRPDGNTDISMEYLKRSVDFGTDVIDIEIQRDHDYIKEMTAYSKQNKVRVILSYHNQDYTPDKEFLESLFYEAENYEPDIIKIAAMVKEDADNDRLLELMELSEKIVPVPLGEQGKKGRLKAYIKGSPINYCYPDGEKPIAPGQLAFSEYKDMDEITRIIHS